MCAFDFGNNKFALRYAGGLGNPSPEFASGSVQDLEHPTVTIV
jgi:hypothetical protein